MPTVRLQECGGRMEYDACTTEELLGSQEGDDEMQTARSTSIEREELNSVSEEDEQALLNQLSALQAAERPRSVRFQDEESVDSQEPSYPRSVVAGIAASSSSPRSPLKKFAPVQDRRVNTVLLEALHLTDISRDEIGLIERSVKRLNDAILGFALLVDKQVKIVGGSSAEERGRIKADIQDLSSQLKASNALIETTCARMKKHLVTGRTQFSTHKRKLTTELGDSDSDISECGTPRCSVNEQQKQYLHQQQEYQSRPHTAGETGIRFNRSPPRPTLTPNTPYGCRGLAAKSPMKSSNASPTKRNVSPTGTQSPRPSQVPLAWILKPRPANSEDDDDTEECITTSMISPDLFSSVLDAVDLQDKEFLEMRDIRTFLHGVFAFFIARNPALKFMDKAYHRRLMPDYVNELADALVMDMQLIPQLSGRSVIVTPVNTLEEYVCEKPFRFNRLLLTVHVNPNSDGPVKDPSPFLDANVATFASSSPSKELVIPKPREPELIETAEQTLGMAKLLHDLATAECEARNGNRISIRAQVPHSKEFSKAYMASSKELMLQETGFL